MPLKSITRGFTLALAVVAGTGAGDAAWREAPDYLELFAPAVHRGDYRAKVSPLDLDAVLRALAADPVVVPAPGAWTPRLQSATDAFGRSGAYNRWSVARLYGSRQPRVARGVRRAGAGVAESWTLVSPYPSADLTRLEPGTLLIVLRIAQ